MSLDDDALRASGLARAGVGIIAAGVMFVMGLTVLGEKYLDYSNKLANDPVYSQKIRDEEARENKKMSDTFYKWRYFVR